jgi:hypothetical protein
MAKGPINHTLEGDQLEVDRAGAMGGCFDVLTTESFGGQSNPKRNRQNERSATKLRAALLN